LKGTKNYEGFMKTIYTALEKRCSSLNIPRSSKEKLSLKNRRHQNKDFAKRFSAIPGQKFKEPYKNFFSTMDSPESFANWDNLLAVVVKLCE
jgi:hypothetical protein